jgi:SAM-dependent methyltransferase
VLRRAIVILWLKAAAKSSALGAALGWDWLTYNPIVKYVFERASQRNAPKVATAVLEQFPSLRTLADIGCGTGRYALEFQHRGLRVVGCEYSASSREVAKARKIAVFPFDLSKSAEPLPGRQFDVALTLEVGEHIPRDLAESFVQYLASTSDLIIFTAAQPGQGGHGHINEQPKSYWIELFARAGYHLDAQATVGISNRLESLAAFDYLVKNLCVFKRTSA